MSSHAVKYEAATALTTLTQNPPRSKVFSVSERHWIWLILFPAAAASCLINLVVKESDNNVKLIVLDRIENLRSKHGPVIDGLVMDLLQVLSR